MWVNFVLRLRIPFTSAHLQLGRLLVIDAVRRSQDDLVVDQRATALVHVLAPLSQHLLRLQDGHHPRELTVLGFAILGTSNPEADTLGVTLSASSVVHYRGGRGGYRWNGATTTTTTTNIASIATITTMATIIATRCLNDVFREAALQQIIHTRVIIREANIDQSLARGAGVRAKVLLDTNGFTLAWSTLLAYGWCWWYRWWSRCRRGHILARRSGRKHLVDQIVKAKLVR
uniref:Putative secreted protein n=1 Tax=Anopheles darlingi TaxID=43151 RepID=A0A2M4DAM8_ANODA